MGYGAILGQQTDLTPYENSIQLNSNNLTLPNGTNITSQISSILGIPSGGFSDFGKMQIVSYVGTGTYGASNPCSVTADFPIKLAQLIGTKVNTTLKAIVTTNANCSYCIPELMQTSYVSESGFIQDTSYSNTCYAKTSSDHKTISWYSGRNTSAQFNTSGTTYYFLLVG